ncbi:MAG TPA: PEGA domain-containing protein [Vicinamibacterales bacterium]
MDRTVPPPDRNGNDRGRGGYGGFYDPYGYYGYGGYGSGYGYDYYYPYGFGMGYGLYSGLGWAPYFGDPYGDPYGGYGGGYGGGYSTSYGRGEQGNLKLKVKPRSAKVYVDGYFVGLVDQFDGAFQKLALNTGRHKVEIKADGFETAEFDVLINAAQTVTFQGALKRIQ